MPLQGTHQKKSCLDLCRIIFAESHCRIIFAEAIASQLVACSRLPKKIMPPNLELLFGLLRVFQQRCHRDNRGGHRVSLFQLCSCLPLLCAGKRQRRGVWGDSFQAVPHVRHRARRCAVGGEWPPCLAALLVLVRLWQRALHHRVFGARPD